MIQRPGPGEIVAGIPVVGSLVGCHRLLKPLFRNALARGEEVTVDGQRCLRWDLGARTPMSPNDPRRAVLAAEIRRAVESARRGAASLRALLDAGTRPESIVVDADTMASLGRPRESARLVRQDAEVLAEVHRVAAVAVSNALERGEFFADETGACLVGWGFIPPAADPLSATVELTMKLRSDSVADDGSWTLHWECIGAAERVYLMRMRDRGGEDGVREAEVSGPRAAGSWHLEASEAMPGVRFRAVAAGGGAHAVSEVLEVPRPWSPPPPEPEPEPEDLPPEPEPEAAPGRRALWLLLLLPILALAAWAGWLLIPVDVASHRDRIRLISPVSPDWAGFKDLSRPGIEVREISLGEPPAPERVLIYVAPRAQGDGP
jgi:hypothetical protein